MAATFVHYFIVLRGGWGGLPDAGVAGVRQREADESGRLQRTSSITAVSPSWSRKTGTL